MRRYLYERDKRKTKKARKKGKHKADPTLGDIVFRVLVIVVIFFIVAITYVLYLQGMDSKVNTNNYQSQNITRTIEKTN